MLRKYKHHLLAFAIVFSVVAFNVKDKFFEIQKNLDIFTTLFKEVNMFYVDEVNPNKLMRTGIDAMLSSLDPYTTFIPEEDADDYRTLTTGQYGGIGALIGNRDGKTFVIMPYEGFPAYKAGLKIGDEILKINGVDVNSKGNTDVSKLLKGPANTPVKIYIRSYGQPSPREIEIKRENIKISNVSYYGLVAKEIGYIKLTDFTAGAAMEVKNAVEKLKQQGAKKMILDIRGNPGGILSEAVNISNLFIPKNQVIVSTKGKVSEWNKTYNSLNEALDTEMPMAVLTDGNSASASEIVAGAIQDYDRGILVGQKTFGKGLVQTTRSLSYNSQIKITIAKYYTPSGRCIQALDYSNRNEDGTVNKFPDSLRTAFKTKSGRTVFDGAGIDPDLLIEKKKYAPITSNLLSKSLIFEYANLYFTKKGSINSPKDFKLSEAEYLEFVKWVKTKNYQYTTQVEKSLDELKEKAKEEKYYASIETQINMLESKVNVNKEADLMTFKEEIQPLLEIEIVARYYLEKGRIQASFANDAELKETIQILNDPVKYTGILKKK